MRKWRVSFTAAVAVMTVFLVPVAARAQAVTLPKVTVVASGLNNPRGLAFSENGALYVADWCDTGECHNYEVADMTNGRIVKVEELVSLFVNEST